MSNAKQNHLEAHVAMIAESGWQPGSGEGESCAAPVAQQSEAVKHPQFDASKGIYWFNVLLKCSHLLGLEDDEPIPSGVLAAVEKLVAGRESAAPVSAAPAAPVANGAKVPCLMCSGSGYANGPCNECNATGYRRAAPVSAQAVREGESEQHFPAVKLTRNTQGMCEVSLELGGKWFSVLRDNGDFISHIVEPIGIAAAMKKGASNG